MTNRTRARIAKERVAQALDALDALAALDAIPGEELVREHEPAHADVKLAWDALNRAAIVLGRIENGEPLPSWAECSPTAAQR